MVMGKDNIIILEPAAEMDQREDRLFSDDLSDNALFGPGDQTNSRRRGKAWLISFTDVVSLMLAFFVLLFSMKEPKQEYLNQVNALLKFESKSYQGQEEKRAPSRQALIERETRTRPVSLNYVEALINQYKTQNFFMQKAEVTRGFDQMQIAWPLSAFKRATLNNAPTIETITQSLSRLDNAVEITLLVPENLKMANYIGEMQRFGEILKRSGYNRDIILNGRYTPISIQSEPYIALEISRR